MGSFEWNQPRLAYLGRLRRAARWWAGSALPQQNFGNSKGSLTSRSYTSDESMTPLPETTENSMPHLLSIAVASALALAAGSATAQSSASYEYRAPVKRLVANSAPPEAPAPVPEPEPEVHPASCQELLLAQPGAVSGWYDLTVNGETTTYFCDMTSNGGGWTRVVRQTEAAPVTDWNGGVNGTSYALSQSQIPAHSQTAFGRDDTATFLDYFNFVYTTGDIPRRQLGGLKTGHQYHIYRSQSMAQLGLDPESADYASPSYYSSLTVDRTGGMNFTWAFAPLRPIAEGRGYAFLGHLEGTAQAYAWTVWVR